MTDQGWSCRHLDLGDVTIHVHDTGDDLPPVVALHGLGGHAGEWEPVAAVLRGRRRVVALDQRGHGGSTRVPGDLTREAHVRDVVAVLDRLGLDRVTLVGQSMGAHTAMLVAARHPDRVSRLVLVEGGPSAAPPAATEDVIGWFRSWPVPFADPGRAVRWFEGQYGPGRTAEAWAAGLEESSAGLVPRFDVPVLREAIDAVHRTERWSEWEAISCPVALVLGQRGSMEAEEARRMLEVNPRARLTTVAAAGHDVHLDDPASVADAVVR